MKKRVVIGGDVYRFKFYVNGFEETENYAKSIGRFTEREMSVLSSGETIKKDDNTFRICYEDEYGHQSPVCEALEE